MSTNKRAGMMARVLILSFLIAGLAGCVKTGSGSSTTTSNISFITLMNMAPYSSATEVYFNSIKQTSAVSAGNYSANYGQIPGGAYSVQFKVSGGDSVLSELPSTSYDSLAFYTLILYNLAGGTAAKAVKISDNYSNLSVGNANYRFWQLSPDLPAVDLYFNSSVVQNGRTLADNVNAYIYNQFESLTPGLYNIQAKKAGTDSVIASVSNVSLAAANAYTIFLQGSSKNSNNPISIKVLLAAY